LASYSFDASRKKEYSGRFKLVKNSLDNAPAFAKLAVTVVDSESGAALGGATITLESPDRNYSYSGTTPTGAMEFPTLASGNYFLSATAPGYSAKQKLRIPIEPTKNSAPRCKITLVKSTQQDKKADGQLDFKNIFDNTYVQTDNGAKRAVELKQSGRSEEELNEWRRQMHAELERNYNSTCSNCGGTVSMMLYPYVDEDFFKTRIFCNNCGWKVDMAKLRAEYEKFKGTTTNIRQNTNEAKPKNSNDDIRNQIEALRAEGNAKLDQIREQLKKMEGKEIKMACPQCGHGGPHYWDGSGWTCPNCGATVCQPSNYPTSAGTYSQVRDEYKRRIAELEAKIK
jgi:rubrerythrin